MFGCLQPTFFDAQHDQQEALVDENVRFLNRLAGNVVLAVEPRSDFERTGAPSLYNTVSWISLHITRYGELKRPSLVSAPNCIFKVYSREITGARALPDTEPPSEKFFELDVYSTEHLTLSNLMTHAAVRTELRMNESIHTASTMYRRAQWAIFRAKTNTTHALQLNNAYQTALRTSFYSSLELVSLAWYSRPALDPSVRFPLQEETEERLV